MSSDWLLLGFKFSRESMNQSETVFGSLWIYVIDIEKNFQVELQTLVVCGKNSNGPLGGTHDVGPRELTEQIDEFVHASTRAGFFFVFNWTEATRKLV